jgi:hypothetical protein
VASRPSRRRSSNACRSRRLGQLVLAGGDDDERGALGEAPADEREQPPAHLVRPVEVLQDDEQRVLVAELRE